jgi:hemoglobin/transferrin/lactoferrin receptor protein
MQSPNVRGWPQRYTQSLTRGLTAACSFTALSIALSYGTAAQAQQSAPSPSLPEVTIETPKPQVKAAPKATPKAAASPKRRARPPRQVAQPVPPPPEPLPPAPLSPEEAIRSATTGAARDAAIQAQVYNTPASVSSVGTSEMSTFGSDLGDVIRSIPGTSVRESPNNPGVAVNIRGMEGSGRVAMSIDGVRQNFRFTGHEAQGFTYFDPSLLAGVDIARGTVSTAGGAGALAGAANFRTIDIIDVLKPGQTAGALSTASYGTNGQNWTGMQAAAVTNGRVGFVGAISGRNPDDFKNGDGITVPYTAQDLVSGLVKGEFKLTPDQKFKVSGVFYRNDFIANSYDQTVTNDLYKAEYNYRPVHTELINFTMNVSRSETEMIYHGPYTSTSPFPLTATGRNVTSTGTNFDASNISILRLGGVTVRSEYGYEYHEDDALAINSATTPDRGVNGTGVQTTEGFFSQTKFSYGIFDLITGLRYDYFTINGSGSIAPGNPIGMPPGPYTVDKDDGRFNPKVTLALNPTKWFMPYVTYAEAMRFPTISETFMGGNHPGAGPGQSFFPNPFLEPEISKGWEFGFNTAVEQIFTPRDVLHFKAAYFNNDVENYITACITPMFQQYFCNNFGTSKVQGIELQGMYDARYLFAGVSYGWNDSNLPSQTNGLGGQSYIPEHTATFSAGVRIFKERWTIGGRVFYASKAFVGFAPFDFNALPDGSHFTDGYALLDLYTKFKITEDIEIGAIVTNVTNEAYTPATSTPGTGSFDGETGRGRTAIFTVRAKF